MQAFIELLVVSNRSMFAAVAKLPSDSDSHLAANLPFSKKFHFKKEKNN